MNYSTHLRSLALGCLALTFTGTSHAALRHTYCRLDDGNDIHYYSGIFVQSYDTLDPSAQMTNPKWGRLVTAFAQAVEHQYPGVNPNSLVTAYCSGWEADYADPMGKKIGEDLADRIKSDKRNSNKVFYVTFDAVD